MKTLTFVAILSLIILAHEAPTYGGMPVPPLPQPNNTPVTPYAPLFTDTGITPASLPPWNPAIVNTKLPTVYTPLPVDNTVVDNANRALDAAKAGYDKTAAASQSNEESARLRTTGFRASQRTRNHQRTQKCTP